MYLGNSNLGELFAWNLEFPEAIIKVIPEYFDLFNLLIFKGIVL